MAYSYDRSRTARYKDLYPDIDSRLAKLFDQAMELSRDAHSHFQNAKSHVRGKPGADDWKAIIKLYDKAIKAWNDVLSASGDYIFVFEEAARTKREDKDARAGRFRRICLDRQREAEGLWAKALKAEKAESERENEDDYWSDDG